MEFQQVSMLLRLILAHLLADFVFQSNGMVKGKRKRNFTPFAVHLSIVGLLTWLLLGSLNLWWAAVAVTILHGIIDYAKNTSKRDNGWVYLADQALHLMSIIVIWWLITPNSVDHIIPYVTPNQWDASTLIIIIGYITMGLPTGVMIGYVTQKWQDQIATNKNSSLKDAGKWIGIIERLLVLTFILIGKWEAIGFLLAAKSVFRFGDLSKSEDHKKTEYILIGTLLSFSIAIAAGLLITMAIA